MKGEWTQERMLTSQRLCRSARGSKCVSVGAAAVSGGKVNWWRCVVIVCPVNFRLMNPAVWTMASVLQNANQPHSYCTCDCAVASKHLQTARDAASNMPFTAFVSQHVVILQNHKEMYFHHERPIQSFVCLGFWNSRVEWCRIVLEDAVMPSMRWS